MAATKYKQVSSIPTKVWVNVQTGVSFVESDTDEYQAFLAWTNANNVPDVDVLPAVVPRYTKLASLIQQGKQAIAAANLNTNDGRQLGAILTQMLDGLGQLDK